MSTASSKTSSSSKRSSASYFNFEYLLFSFTSSDSCLNLLPLPFLTCIFPSVSLVGIATDYELDGPGSNTGEDECFRPSRPAHPASCKMGTGSFSGVKCGRGVLLTTHPLLVPRSWKSRAIPVPTLCASCALLQQSTGRTPTVRQS